MVFVVVVVAFFTCCCTYLFLKKKKKNDLAVFYFENITFIIGSMMIRVWRAERRAIAMCHLLRSVTLIWKFVLLNNGSQSYSHFNSSSTFPISSVIVFYFSLLPHRLRKKKRKITGLSGTFSQMGSREVSFTLYWEKFVKHKENLKTVYESATSQIDLFF